MKLLDLIKEMRKQGVDIFPDHDSHCYIEGLPLKDIQTERHLYNCMALTANVSVKTLSFIHTSSKGG